MSIARLIPLLPGESWKVKSWKGRAVPPDS